jgi:integrase
MPRKKISFPYRHENNGRHGMIYLCGDGKFKTHFKFAHKYHQNTFVNFENALAFLEKEFNTLDTKLEESSSQFPLERDRKHYFELEQLLKQKSDGASLWQAVDFFLNYNKKKKFTPMTVSDCADRYIQESIDTNLTISQIKNLKKHFRRFSKTFGNRKIHDLETLEIKTWLSSQKDRYGKPWSPKTRKNCRGTLVGLSIYARDTLNAIPAEVEKTEFQKVKAPETDQAKPVEIYTPKEMANLLRTAIATDIDLIPILVVGGFMGLRPAEAHGQEVKRDRLQWEDFMWQDGFLPIYGQKVRSKPTRHVPIPSNAAAWLRPFKSMTGEVWRFKKAFDTRFAKLRGLAGVGSIHDGLRHSYCSYRYRILSGKVDQLADEMGNSKEEIMKSYKRNVTDKEANAWFAIKPPSNYAKSIKLVLDSRQKP